MRQFKIIELNSNSKLVTNIPRLIKESENISGLPDLLNFKKLVRSYQSNMMSYHVPCKSKAKNETEVLKEFKRASKLYPDYLFISEVIQGSYFKNDSEIAYQASSNNFEVF